MSKEEIGILFKKYNVRIPKEKQGHSVCKKCKENHEHSLTWTSFLYEYEKNYYCYKHIVNILLEMENKQLEIENKQLKKAIDLINDSLDTAISLIEQQRFLPSVELPINDVYGLILIIFNGFKHVMNEVKK